MTNNDYLKKSLQLAGLGISLGVAAKVASDLGNEDVSKGISRISRGFPIIGSVYGASLVIGSLKQLEDPFKKKKQFKLY